MSSPSVEILQAEFRDSDELAQIVKAWDLDFKQLDAGSFEGRLLQFSGSSSQVSHTNLGRVIDQGGTTPRGLRTFAVLAETSSPIVWRNQIVEPDSIMVFPRGREIDAVSRPGFEVYTISFSEELLSNLARALEFDYESVVKRGDVLRVDPRKLARLRTWLQAFCTTALEARFSGATPEEGSGLLHDLEEECPRQLLTALLRSEPGAVPASLGARRKALARAKECIERHPPGVLTVSALCQEAGVGERTMQYAFRERFGVTPKAYLRDVRLNRVRSELRSLLTDEVQVGAVARKWGFWHLGQFAADYRRLFGELPSETLSQASRRPGG